MKFEISDNFNSVKELKEKHRKAAIIWDETLDSKLVSAIGNCFSDCIALSVTGDEKCKTIETYRTIMSHLTAFRLDRSDVIIGIGGGSVLDLTGYVASTYMRGVSVVYIPTTLLSMVDSAVTGKNGINIDGVKNMAGTFRMPDLSVINPAFLVSLPEKEFKSGIAEIIKAAVLLDKEMFEKLKEHPVDITDIGYLTELITKVCEMKLASVTDDPYDTEEGRFFSFGETVGHAIESASGFTVKHGYADACGMVMETQMFGNAEVLKELKECLKKNGLPVASSLDRKTIIKNIIFDKKICGEYISIPVIDEIGKCHMEDIKVSDIK